MQITNGFLTSNSSSVAHAVTTRTLIIGGAVMVIKGVMTKEGVIVVGEM
jgi:hypothetical protein